MTVGQHLEVLEDTTGASHLIEGIIQGDTSAEAELTALNLITHRNSRIESELFPEFMFESQPRISDFRVRQDSEPWVYVEVTQPELSQAHNRAQTALDVITGLLADIKVPLALEVYLRREPTDQDLELLVQHLPVFCQLAGAHQEELANDLGILILNQSKPGHAVFRDSAGEKGPGIGTMTAIRGPEEPHRSMSVTMPFSDARAASFLQHKARQLPDDAPGLVMVQMSRAQGGFTTWEPVLRKSFERYKWVSGVCMFMSGSNSIDNKEAWLPETKLIINPYATLVLPQWTVDQLNWVPDAVRRELGLA